MKNHLLKPENTFEEHLEGKLKFVRYKLRKHEYIGWVLEHKGESYGKSFRVVEEMDDDTLEKMKHFMMEHAIGTYRDLEGYQLVTDEIREGLETTTEASDSTS